MYLINVTEIRTKSFVIDEVQDPDQAIETCKRLYSDRKIELDEMDISETRFKNVEPSSRLEIILDDDDGVVWKEDGKFYYSELIDGKIQKQYKAILVASLFFPISPNCSKETIALLFDSDICGEKTTDKGRAFLWYRKGEEVKDV